MSIMGSTWEPPARSVNVYERGCFKQHPDDDEFGVDKE